MLEKDKKKEHQLSSIKELTGNYNSDANDILHQAQQEFNENLIKERESDHRNYKTIEKEAREILRTAHKEGEIHIHERHRKTPSIFYTSQNKIFVWSEGKKYDMGPPTSAAVKPFVNILKVVNYTDLKDKDVQALLLFGAQKTHRDAYYKNKKIYHYPSTLPETNFFFNDYNITEKDGEKLHTIKFNNTPANAMSKNIWDIYIENVNYICRLGDNYIYFVIDSSGKEDHIKIPIRPLLSSSYTPKFTGQIKNKIMWFYVIQEDKIIQTSAKNKKIDPILTQGEVIQPIDLVYHSPHDSLLIQDAEKKEIGVHLLDEPKERFWRSFSKTTDAISIPAISFSNETFTLSCLLRLADKDFEAKPITESPIRFWMKGDKVYFQYYFEGELIDLSFPKGNFFPEESNPDWFQFAVQKDENQFRFYANGVLIFNCNAPESIDLLSEKKISLSCPGYFIAELRIWNIIRTPEQLKTYNKTWLPVSQYNGLTGYWHFYVKEVLGKFTGLEYEHVNKNGQLEIIQEPDLSGNGHHLITQKKSKANKGELNYDTLHPIKAPSPFPKVISLYDLKIIKQGLEIDDNTGKIYWIDEAKDGRVYMMCGSTLGHTPIIQLFEIDSDSDFAVLSQINSPYEGLILAHAKRRKAMEKEFEEITSAHTKGHKDVLKKHKELLSTLDKSLGKEKQNQTKKSKENYNKTHKEWLQAIDHMNKEQENLVKASKRSRENALEKAKKMTDKAQLTVIESRKITYDKK